MDNDVLFVEILLVFGPPPMAAGEGTAVSRFESSYSWRITVRKWMVGRGIEPTLEGGDNLAKFFVWWEEEYRGQ